MCLGETLSITSVSEVKYDAAKKYSVKYLWREEILLFFMSLFYAYLPYKHKQLKRELK